MLSRCSSDDSEQKEAENANITDAFPISFRLLHEFGRTPLLGARQTSKFQVYL